jgi:glucose/mannose-6-phosphate isomerase
MTEMLGMIRSLGGQLRWASQLELPSFPDAPEILVTGMGGSGISGTYAAAVAGEDDGRVSVHKDYAPLPGWVGAVKPLVVVVSYSGDTEETLDAVGDAAARGLGIVAVTTGGALGDLARGNGWPTVAVPGGLQPRAALGYLFGAVVRISGSLGLVADSASQLAAAGSLVDGAVKEGSPSWVTARRVADELRGRIAIVYGGGPISGAAAGRWKTQINENGKMPAWHSLLPELDHNELVGWEAMPELTREHLGIVALTDAADHPRVRARLDHSSALTQDAVPWVAEIGSHGDSAAARLMSLTIVGDLVSWMMAEDAGIDPVPVDTIQRLKRLLADSG